MVSVEEAQGVLKEHEEVIAEIVYGAWDDWKSKSPAMFAEPYRRTSRVVVYNLIAERVKQVFGDREKEGIRVLEAHESVFVLFGDEIAVRFKKLDEDLQPSNIRTSRQMELDMQLPLPEVPNCSRLIVGYVPDAVEEDILVYVTCRENGRNVWDYSLSRPVVATLVAFDSADEVENPPDWTFKPKAQPADANTQAE